MYRAPTDIMPFGDGEVRQRAGIDPMPRSRSAHPRASPWQPEDRSGLRDLEECNQHYVRLMSNVARRHPNPGVYRFREGNVGASWRHIREVLSYGGNRICYVDGKVRLYDETGLNEAFSRGSIGVKRRYDPKAYAPVPQQFAPQRYPSDPAAYKPWQSVVEMPEKLPPITNPGVQARMPKVKGHYVY